MNIDTSEAVYYYEGQFPPQALNYGRLMPAVIDATAALARYDQMLKSLHNSEIFLAPLRKQEAVISSRMEGTISTMDEILQLEAEYDGDEKPPSGSDVRSDVVETALYHRSLRTAQKQMEEGRPLSESLIKSIHQQLLSFGRGAKKSPGAYKTEQNYIGERGSRKVSFVPIAPEKLPDGMEALFRYLDNGEIPVLLRTAVGHAEFEALHPFEDGNGRLGRMIITLLLWSGRQISAPHFYISGFFEDRKDEYIHRMREVSAHGAWDDWCEFFLLAVQQQAQNNLKVAEDISRLYEEMKIEFADLLSSKYSTLALDYIFTNPVFRNSSFTNKSGIPSQTAARFSRVLLTEKLIEVVSEPSGRKSAIYRFNPLMELVRV